MTRPDPAELAAWNAAQRRARDEYRAHPVTNVTVAGPCIAGCGVRTRTHSGLCRDCERTEG